MDQIYEAIDRCTDLGTALNEIILSDGGHEIARQLAQECVKLVLQIEDKLNELVG